MPFPDSSATSPLLTRYQASPDPNNKTTTLLNPEDAERIQNSASILLRRLRYTFSFNDTDARKWKLADVYKDGVFRQALYIRSLVPNATRPEINFGAAENAGIIMALQHELRGPRVFLGKGPLMVESTLEWHELEFRFLIWTGRDGYERHRISYVDMELGKDKKEFGYEGDGGRESSWQAYLSTSRNGY
ncbi:uncharacterized protein N0V89_011679 [Didymosphaeria variabile]|uniref:Uncharacterized protein n=1 Tax=Didymosphaeria variabile TaxID=1932322 RepID=A0A9W8XAH7_9PLEO|nr:uncharacterized protein N0V89_011679 [Didymosphaeria variabile]KAJ4345546.1 hypothetical protein N0V89_011679 [Didymosphaeria variabile]